MREHGLDLDLLGRSESVFALANGHIGLRAQPRRGRALRGARAPTSTRSTRCGPLPYAETAYGLPEAGPDARERDERQAHPPARRRRAVRRALRRPAAPRARARPARRRAAPRGRVALADRPRGAACARRASSRSSTARWRRSPTRSSRSTRATRIVVQSELVANEPGPAPSSTTRARPPRCAARSHAEQHGHHELRAGLVHATRRSKLRMAAAMDHVVEGPEGTDDRDRERARPRARHAHHRARAGRDAARGQAPGLRVVEPALARLAARPGATPRWPRRAGAAGTGSQQEQRAYLDDFWERADVELEGDAELQQALRFALFHTLQAGARAERRAIPAKGLTGTGYDGHSFWDMETLRAARPDLHGARRRGRRAALAPLRARPRARACAASSAAQGAAFPWRTIRGQECSGYWPAGTAALPHQRRHRRRRAPLPRGDRRRRVRARGRPRAARRDGAPVALAGPPRRRTARSASTASPVPTSTARSPTTTSTRTSWPPATCARRPTRPPATPTSPPSSAWTRRRWRAGATPPRAMSVPYDEELGVHQQAEDFTHHRHWDFAATRAPTSTRCCCTSPTTSSTARRSSSRPTSCSPSTSAATTSTTSRRRATSPTTRRSPSATRRCRPAMQAIVAAEVGHLDLAYDYFGETALIDLHDLQQQHARRACTSPSLGAAWLVAVGGLRRDARPRRGADASRRACPPG